MTVAINSWQNAKTFNQFLTNQVQDSTILRAKAAAQSVSEALENWSGQINLVMHDIQRMRADEYNNKIAAFVNSSHDFLAFHVYSQSGKTQVRMLSYALTELKDNSQFEGKDGNAVLEKLKTFPQTWLTSYLQSGGGNKIIVETFADQLQVPAMAIAVPYSRSGSKETLWAVLTTWHTRISSALPKSDVMRSNLIDNDGFVFSAPTFEEIVAHDSLKWNALARTAITGTTMSGFKGGYKDKSNEEWLGAFVRIPKYGMSVLVENKAKVAYAAIQKIITKTALWGFLLVLIAVMVSFVGAGGLTRNLRAVINATRSIASGDFETRVKPRSRDEIAMLGVSVNQMAQQILDLLGVQVEQARVEKELETARMVQSTFFPKANITAGTLQIAGYYEPATECGGDWWGHFSSNHDDGVEYVFIADAMGHGVPAALVTAMAYSSCMTLSNIIQDREMHHNSPAKILERFNKVLYEAVRGTISMTFFAAIFDTKNGVLHYANAGHNFPVLVPLDENDDRAAKKRSKHLSKISNKPPISLALQGVPLGMAPETTYEQQSIPIRAGDKFFFFTDGLIECTGPDGKAWGRKLLLENILKGADVSANEMKEVVVKNAFEHFNGVPLKDDVTIVVVEAGAGSVVVASESNPPFENEVAIATPGIDSADAASELNPPLENDDEDESIDPLKIGA